MKKYVKPTLEVLETLIGDSVVLYTLYGASPEKSDTGSVTGDETPGPKEGGNI